MRMGASTRIGRVHSFVYRYAIFLNLKVLDLVLKPHRTVGMALGVVDAHLICEVLG
jgi:hypothetical protein